MSYIAAISDCVVVQEQFCFGEEITKILDLIKRNPEVNITRRAPACETASINLTLSLMFDAMGTPLCKLICHTHSSSR